MREPLRLRYGDMVNFLRQELFLAASLLASSLVFLYALLAARGHFWQLNLLPQWVYPTALLLSLFVFCVLACLLIVKWSLGNNPEPAFEGIEPTKKPQKTYQEANEDDPIWQTHPYAVGAFFTSALATVLCGLTWWLVPRAGWGLAGVAIGLPETFRAMFFSAVTLGLGSGLYLAYKALFGEPANEQAEEEYLKDQPAVKRPKVQQ